jgi:hypothetical protein
MTESTEEVLKEFMLYQAHFNKDLVGILDKLAKLIYKIDDKILVEKSKKRSANVMSELVN